MKESKKTSKAEHKLKAQTLKAILTDPLGIDPTADLCSAALQSHRDLAVIVKAFLGGTFDVQHFKIQQYMVGVRLWYCYNTDINSKLPKFFLAVEQISYYNESNPEEVTKPDDSLLAVAETFVFDSTKLDPTEVKKFILNTPSTSQPESNRVITQSTVLRYARNFKKLMTDISVSSGILYCKYAVAFFQNNTTYNDFMWNNPLKIKYYIGLAVDAAHKPNYLRPILAGVDSTGSIITQTSINATEPLLQKSFPPPPYT